MRNLGLSIVFAAVLAGSAAAAPVSSVCSFETPSGQQAKARFDIEDNLVRSTLTVSGNDVPALQPACFAHRRGGLRCPHADSERRYELYPQIDDETNQVLSIRVIVYQGEDTLPFVEGTCSKL